MFFLPLLMTLGFWQLSRAEEKRQLLAVYQQQRDLPAVPLEDVANEAPANYRQILVKGQYNNDKYWLLDNRSREGIPGYEILMPLVDSNVQVLVNRGWVAAPPRRDQLPVFETPSDIITIEGYLYPSESNALIKHSVSDLAVDWPRRVLQLDAQAAEQALNQPFYPLILRIDQDSPGALITNWQVSNSTPARHQGYAVQWFTMAAALMLLYGWVIKRTKNDDQN